MKDMTIVTGEHARHGLIVTPDRIVIQLAKYASNAQKKETMSFFDEVIEDLIDTQVTMRGRMSIGRESIQMLSNDKRVKKSFHKIDKGTSNE